METDKKHGLIGERIRMLRKEKDISQEDLADRAEINRSYLSVIENGKSSPTLDVAERLAKGLGVETTELLSPSSPRHFKYDDAEGFETYPGLQEFLDDHDLMLLMNPTLDEIEWLRGSRFNNFLPSKKFFQELLLARRKTGR